ncbi:MAG TPA: ThiF family adenylyltransferase [Streptosporangiaceae bacterium]
MSDDIILMAAHPAERIKQSSANWGRLAIGHSNTREIFHVVGVSESTGKILTSIAFGPVKVDIYGTWCRATPSLHATHARLARIGYALDAASFREQLDISQGSLADHGATIVVTHCPQGNPEWAGWRLTLEQASPLELDVLHPPTDDPLALLEPKWPVHDLGEEVVVVGVGSIGSAAASALAMYGVRKITLVDDDRLLWHNLVRHQSTRHAVGQYKVDAVSDAIRSRWPATKTLALRLNVIAHADLMRPLFRRCALILCASDGVASRRVVSHLARRAERTAILACVLMDGAFGEIIRLRPWPGWGCLLCQRAHLVSTGTMDPEPELDSGYGTGTTHRPMTAVGSDLVLVGQYAAKVAVATLLENAGHHDQCIEPDWAIIGLRGDLTAPEPFNLYPGEVRWLPHVQPNPGCPTCGSA